MLQLQTKDEKFEYDSNASNQTKPVDVKPKSKFKKIVARTSKLLMPLNCKVNTSERALGFNELEHIGKMENKNKMISNGITSDVTSFAERQQLWLDEAMSAICQAKVREEMKTLAASEANLTNEVNFVEIPQRSSSFISDTGIHEGEKGLTVQTSDDTDDDDLNDGIFSGDNMSATSIDFLYNWLTCHNFESPKRGRPSLKGMVITTSRSIDGCHRKSIRSRTRHGNMKGWDDGRSSRHNRDCYGKKLTTTSPSFHEKNCHKKNRSRHGNGKRRNRGRSPRKSRGRRHGDNNLAEF